MLQKIVLHSVFYTNCNLQQEMSFKVKFSSYKSTLCVKQKTPFYFYFFENHNKHAFVKKGMWNSVQANLQLYFELVQAHKSFFF